MTPERRALRVFMAAILITLLALLPVWFDDSDWNGLVVNTLTMVLWAIAMAFIFTAFPRRKSHSGAATAAIFLVCCFVLWGLQSSGFLWAKDLGHTPDEIRDSLRSYESENASFRLIYGIFDAKSEESCSEFCRTLRQYTNIQNATASQLQLVDNLAPASGSRPNIFIFVVDSLRADYVGALNPKADFTPNLDALARDSLVMRKAFTQYAGTSLSEPAIWSGALLLHSHYMRPFENVNSLEKLARNDGYQMAVSYDHILRNILTDSADIVKFDTDKRFNEMEISSTLAQLEAYLDTRPDKNQPILFYAQPMNLHVLGTNHLPQRTSTNWRHRPGFVDRIAFKLNQVDEAMGQFIAYLKSRGLYDQSIIVVTADHGDALAELPGFGLVRKEHSVILFPEVMRVPLIVHLPREMREKVVYDENRVTALTDITPTLYYLLGHCPIRHGFVYGQPFVASSWSELREYQRDHMLLASDARAAYGILSGDGRFFYATYDSPEQSLFFDLQKDPEGLNNIVNPQLAAHYNGQIVDDLRAIAAFYHYNPDGGSSGRFSWDRTQ